MNDRISPDVSPSGVPRPEAALAPGTRLGAVELKQVVAHSASSVVYLATDHALGRDVAIQEYLPAGLVRRDAALRLRAVQPWQEDVIARGLRAFVDEAAMLARCDHPALVRVNQLVELHGTAYRTMPWYDAERLIDLRSGMNAAPREAAVRLLLDDLLGALEAIHRNGRRHGGVVPANILMRADGRPLLLGPGAAAKAIGNDLVEALMASIEAPSVAGEPSSRAAPVNAIVDLRALAEVARFWITGVVAGGGGDSGKGSGSEAPGGVMSSSRDRATWREPLSETIARSFEPALRPVYGAKLLAALDAVSSTESEQWPRDVAQLRQWLAEGPPGWQRPVVTPSGQRGPATSAPTTAGAEIAAGADAAAGTTGAAGAIRAAGSLTGMAAALPPDAKAVGAAAAVAPFPESTSTAWNDDWIASPFPARDPEAHPAPVGSSDNTVPAEMWATAAKLRATALGVRPPDAPALDAATERGHGLGRVVPSAASARQLPGDDPADSLVTDRAPWAGPPSERQRRNRYQKTAVVAGLLALAGVVLVVVVSGSWNQVPQISLDRLPTALTEHVATPAIAALPNAGNRAVDIAPVTATPAESLPTQSLPNDRTPIRPGPVETAPNATQIAPPIASPIAPTIAPTIASSTAAPTTDAPGGNLPDKPRPGDAGPPSANAAVVAAPNPAAASTVASAALPSAGKGVEPVAAATSPRAACGARTEFSLYRCMQQQCESRRWSSNAQCVRFRETDSVE